MNKEMQKNFERLKQWTDTLALTVENVLPQVKDALDGKVQLPKNCPSKEAMAELELGRIEKNSPRWSPPSSTLNETSHQVRNSDTLSYTSSRPAIGCITMCLSPSSAGN